MKHLIIVALGPVQEFIATARRSRDLWYGSWMLSELSKTVAKKIEEISPGCLVFPAPTNKNALDPESNFTTPNKVVAILDNDGAGGEIQLAVRKRLDSLWESALTQVKKKGGQIDESTAKKQIDDLLELYWVSVPIDENKKNGYVEARDTAERLLAARKVTRDFNQPNWSSNKPKSSLDGTRESVIPQEAYPILNDPKEKEKIENLYVCYHARRGEQLSGVDILKRLGNPQPSRKFKSTSDMAAIPFISRLGADRGNELLEKIKKMLPDNRDQLDGAEEGLVFERRFEDGFPLQQLSDDVRKKYTDLLYKYAGASRPNPYYALLAADGDYMGVVIDSQVKPDDHRELSKALSQFAEEAPRIIEGKQGVPIYTGGDDVLAYLPLHTVLACAKELADKFRQLLQGFRGWEENGREITPTLSVGISVTHHLEPLSDALELARNAEKTAKGVPEKNGLAVIVSKRGGAERTISGKWGVVDIRLDKLIQLYQGGAISAGTAYELQELHRVLSKTGIPADGIEKEALRIVSRKQEAGGVKGVDKTIRDLFSLWIIKEKITLDELAREMIIAGLFAGNAEPLDELAKTEEEAS